MLLVREAAASATTSVMQEMGGRGVLTPKE
jgi:hypothetical protein